MAINTTPAFGKAVKTWIGSISAANTAYDGTGTVVTLGTANATDGSFVRRLKIKALGTNVASVMRIFVNNGSTNTSAANNAIFEEVKLPATTAIQTDVLQPFEVQLNIALQAGWKILITLGTAVSAGYVVTAEVWDYS